MVTATDRHVVLVGMMGAGKTTVGERLAARLERPFLDTDRLVEAEAGVTVAELFATRGELAFRALERTAVMQACSSPVSAVIACGGGAVLDPASRDRLTSTGVVVWLRAPAEVLAARVGHSSGRPLLAAGSSRPDPATRLAELEADRASTYAAVAQAEVDTTGRDIDAVVDAVLEELDRCVA